MGIFDFLKKKKKKTTKIIPVKKENTLPSEKIEEKTEKNIFTVVEEQDKVSIFFLEEEIFTHTKVFQTAVICFASPKQYLDKNNNKKIRLEKEKEVHLFAYKIENKPKEVNIELTKQGYIVHCNIKIINGKIVVEYTNDNKNSIIYINVPRGNKYCVEKIITNGLNWERDIFSHRLYCSTGNNTQIVYKVKENEASGEAIAKSENNNSQIVKDNVQGYGTLVTPCVTVGEENGLEKYLLRNAFGELCRGNCLGKESFYYDLSSIAAYRYLQNKLRYIMDNGERVLTVKAVALQLDEFNPFSENINYLLQYKKLFLKLVEDAVTEYPNRIMNVL